MTLQPLDRGVAEQDDRYLAAYAVVHSLFDGAEDSVDEHSNASCPPEPVEPAGPPQPIMPPGDVDHVDAPARLTRSVGGRRKKPGRLRAALDQQRGARWA